MSKARALAAAAALSLLAAGCTVGPDFLRPKPPAVEGYTPEKLAPETASAESAPGKLAGGEAQRFVEAEDIPGQWWTLFHSASLNALIGEALKANPDLEAAQAALRQAKENVYADQGSLFPTVTANGSATREKLSGASFGNPGFSPTLSVTTASLSVSYLLDVFGGVRRQVESAEAQADYQRFQLEATYLTLTANVVNAAVTLASLRDQIAATEDIINIERDQLKVVNQQFQLGATSKADVLTQESTLAQTRATLPPLQKQLAQARNQLMTYLGRFPSQYKGETFELASLALPAALPVSLPSKLVEQRPDVRAAESQLHEASANVGVAIANQLPQFNITGQIGNEGLGFDKMFSPGTGIWSIGGSVAQTIFDAGTLEHRKRAAVAAYDQAAAQYRSTVLSAFQDVANALRALQTDADTLKAQVIAERSALDSLTLSREQYRLGAINYLTLLNAEQTYQNAIVSRVRAQAARYSDTAALFQALGGGWWHRADVAPESEGTPDRFNLPPVQDIKLPTTR
jgi:NodT family efflux transporter outer membrane factor (OMF) lipoprotein